MAWWTTPTKWLTDLAGEARVGGMRKQVVLWCWGICLAAQVTHGGDVIASFAKQSLGLDLSDIPFGLPIMTNSQYGLVDAPREAKGQPWSAGWVWVTNAVSGKYHADYPSRVLSLGFKSGRLAVVNVGIRSFADHRTGFDAMHLQLIEIERAIQEATRKSQQRHDSLHFQLEHSVMCGPETESLFAMDIQIMPAGKTP